MMLGLGRLTQAARLVRLLSTSAAAEGAPPALSLVRDFIHDSLYNPRYGYFAAQAAPVGTLRAPIVFRRLQGHKHYLRTVQEVYQELQAAWLTPVEIFQPHFGAGVAHYIAQHHLGRLAGAAAGGDLSSLPPLRVYEVGGGTGTLARNILDWLRLHKPQLYGSCRYTCIEISPTLAQLQRRRVAEEGGHGACFDVVQQDGASAAAWGSPSDEACYVVLMEVLDNMPHDRVWRAHAGEPWQQTLVASSPVGSSSDSPSSLAQECSGAQPAPAAAAAAGGGSCGGWGPAPPEALSEVLEPVADPLILRCLDSLEQQQGAGGGGVAQWAAGALRDWVSSLARGPVGEAAFLPTGCLAFLDTLCALRPRHHLIAADFDQLPEVTITGRNAPLVATTAGGRTLDHDTYLVPRGCADIFFPTDFGLLARLYADAAARARAQHGAVGGAAGTSAAAQARHLKAGRFMRCWADAAATRTRSGYNPLLEDYSNTAFFLGTAC